MSTKSKLLSWGQVTNRSGSNSFVDIWDPSGKVCDSKEFLIVLLVLRCPLKPRYIYIPV